MLIFLPLLSIVCYLTAAAWLVLPLMQRSTLPRGVALCIATIGVLVHGGILYSLQQGGFDLHFFSALSLVGMCIAGLTLLVNLSRPVAGLGVIVFPLAALLLTVDTFLATPTMPLAIAWQIKLHVAVALMSYCVLSIAALLAILLALQERALRRHRLNSNLIHTLPPLTLTEALMFQLIGTGFALLTLTLLTGVLFVENLFAQHLVHKTILSFIAWIVFGILLFGRWRYGWRGKRAVQLTLIGMAVLVLAFFGSKFVLELVLKRTL